MRYKEEIAGRLARYFQPAVGTAERCSPKGSPQHVGFPRRPPGKGGATWARYDHTLCRRRKCKNPQHAGRIHVTAAPAAGVSSASPLPLDAKLASASPAGASAPLAARRSGASLLRGCLVASMRASSASAFRLRFRRLLLLLLLRPCLCLRLRHLLVSALGRPRLLLRPPNQPGRLRHVWLWDLGHDCPPDRPSSHPPWRGWPRFLRSITLSQLCPRGIDSGSC